MQENLNDDIQHILNTSLESLKKANERLRTELLLDEAEMIAEMVFRASDE